MKQTLSLTAIILLIASQALALTDKPLSQDTTYWTSGIRINQGHPFGLLGITRQLSSRIFQFAGTDLGGSEAALCAQTLIRITTIDNLTLFAAMGPQVEYIDPGTTDDNLIAYLTGSVGMILSLRATKTLTLFAGAEYLITDNNIKHWKVAVGISFPILK